MHQPLQHIEQLIDLIDPSVQRLRHPSLDQARVAVLSGSPQRVRQISGSFAIVARDGKTVRMARSLDRPMRYFLAKQKDGPVLIIADRIDAIAAWLREHGMADQFHPSYTRMVPAHHVVEIQLVGCPDPDPLYTRFLEAAAETNQSIPADVDEIGRRYISAVAREVVGWLESIPAHEPIGVCFSGGIDSGAAFLLIYHSMRKLGLNPARLKAFTLRVGGEGADAAQAQRFLQDLDLALFGEIIDVDEDALDADQAIAAIEDYKPLDVQCATMGLALCRAIRQRYPQWHYLADGDGGDENLKDYPIEDNPELTIRSVVNNPLLYQEGWGVGKIKHSLVYSGGLSRSYTRTYAPGRQFGFEGFSPFTRADVVEIAERIPFAALTDYDIDRLYELKGRIVAGGVAAVTGLRMPVYPKRRFQHGAAAEQARRGHLDGSEAEYRKRFLALYA
jgi:asparagine synthase (glutamine-hydrolysing)